MKSRHIFINGIIPYSELRYFIEPITVTIPVPLGDLKSIGGNKSEEFYNRYKNTLKHILERFPLLTLVLNIYLVISFIFF